MFFLVKSMGSVSCACAVTLPMISAGGLLKVSMLSLIEPRVCLLVGAGILLYKCHLQLVIVTFRLIFPIFDDLYEAFN